MHGTRVLLSRKIRFFTQQSRELKSDVVAFAYRSFTHSDPAPERLTEEQFGFDIDAITTHFEQLVTERGGPSNVESILWGKSFGCATAIVTHLSKAYLHEQIVLESPFTSVPATFVNFLPCGLGRLLGCITRIQWRND